MSRRALTAAIAAAVAFVVSSQAADTATEWLEVAAPGRGGGVAGQSEQRAVVDLVPFDGGVYVILAPRHVSTSSDPRDLKNAPPPRACPILRYDPEALDVRSEMATTGARFGRLRVIDSALHVPVAEPVEGASGYYVSEGGGEWQWVQVDEQGTEFHDIVRFDGKTFLAGRRGGAAVVLWRESGENAWHTEELNQQAARFSYRAQTFLHTPGHLSLLAVRDVIGEWPPRVAPREWGAWYVLHYHFGGSARGFLFDGQARPLPVLRAMAGGSQLAGNTRYRVCRDVAWGDGLLYTLLGDQLLLRDERGALFHGTVRKGNPQQGTTLFGSRVPAAGRVRDICVDDGVCTVLASQNLSRHAKVLASPDLETWRTLFEGELPDIPVSLALIEEDFLVGMADGTLLMLTRSKDELKRE